MTEKYLRAYTIWLHENYIPVKDSHVKAWSNNEGFGRFQADQLAAKFYANYAEKPTDSRLPAFRFDQVVSFVCTHYGLSVSSVMGERRFPSVANARNMCYMMLRYGFDQAPPLEKVGSYFNRDHSTVMYGIGVVKASPDLMQEFKMIRDKFLGETA